MRTKPAISAAALAALALVVAKPALADVKDGVDAWARGDFARAIAEWKGPAAKGDADAMFNLAQAYRLGRGVPENLREAEVLYSRAAAKGHLQAADNYGLLLFQDGRREAAMPYVTAAAERGDPRAQYLLGIAHFNGDFVARDYVRAYALLTLANGAGLPQAAPSIRQMDDFIPLEQRQQAQSLAGRMRADADARRASAMAAVDLGTAPAAIPAPAAQVVAAAAPIANWGAGQPPSLVADAEAAVAEAMRATGAESPATAGADFARPTAVAAVRPQPRPASGGVPAAAGPAVSGASGAWKLQLGAFSVAGGADRLWAQLSGKPALAGKTKQTAKAGKLTRLFAAGWPSQAEAQAACGALKAGGQGCIVTR